MTQETIKKLHELEKIQNKFNHFYNTLVKERQLASIEFVLTDKQIDKYSHFVGGDYNLNIIDEGDFIESVLTLAKERLLQIDNEIAKL